MYGEYAKDPRMKINLGIRRRLAPLLDNGRDEIELMHAILFSLPGTPGPLLRRRDRDGRQRLPRRPRRRPHPDAVDGRPQRRLLAARTSPSSTRRRSWTRSTATRPSTSRPSCARRPRCCAGCTASSRCARSTRSSAWATTSRCRPSNPRIFAHVRTYDDDVVLCVHNLARSAQAVELDLSAYEGRYPEEMFGRSRFPRIGELPYLLTLAPARVLLVPAREEERESRTLAPSAAGEIACPTRSCASACRPSAGSASSRRSSRTSRRRRDPRWREPPPRLAVARGRVPAGTHELYQLPLGARPEAAGPRASICVTDGLAIYDALRDPETARALVRRSPRDAEVETRRRVRSDWAGAAPAAPADGEVRPMGAEQSNSSIVFDERLGLKAFRRLGAGRQPRARDAALPHRARLPAHRAAARAGTSYRAGSRRDARASCRSFLAGGRDGWELALDALAERPRALRSTALEALGEVIGADAHGAGLRQLRPRLRARGARPRRSRC